MELAGEREGLPLVRAAAQLCSVLLFAVLPLVLMPAVLHAAGADFLWDFRKEFLPAGEAILHGDSPYPPSLSDLASHANYVYPPLAAVLMAPFTWLPQVLAEGIFVALTLVAPALALWLLGVRDWRCFGLVYLWPPLLNAVSLGTLSTLLALAVAAGWRWRRSAVVLGAALAGAAVAKLFLWPLLVLFGSRWRAAAISVAVACIAVLASWALIGFAGMTAYPTLLQELSRIEAPRGYSPTSLALALGLPRGTCAGRRVRRGAAAARARRTAGAARTGRDGCAGLRGRRLAGALAGRLDALPDPARRADRGRTRPTRAHLVRPPAVLAHSGRGQQRRRVADRIRARRRRAHALACGIVRARPANSALTCSQAARAASSGAISSDRACA